MITFIPKRTSILMCDFDLAFVPPEMVKLRQVVVISADRHNHRHANRAGLCTVVPFSATPPDSDKPSDVFIPAGSYWSLKEPSWARTAMVSTVSHARLDLVLRYGRRHRNEFVSAADMERIESALRGVLGLA